ncbi:hypothetical protein HI914_04691 [Erysiphe necator]|uniref:Putative udp-galactose transporter like protein n=1 Tax=Uncinula necator TaxID=52586 RepID=A0A0B1PHL6_UNCNE|nr:hypothetical protein HI914_04691 [Erysiphe necator]KHJ36034.1 putative udp-galactose transporter like protein [Erysiphe necator]
MADDNQPCETTVIDKSSNYSTNVLKDNHPAVIPIGESEEDAALRQLMLQYETLEVGAVVAELQIEDDSDESSNWSENCSDQEEVSNSDEEDEFGRYTGRVVSDQLRQQMKELEGRLGKEMNKNISDKSSDFKIVEEGIGRIAIQDEKNNTLNPKKSVRFSENPEISLFSSKLPVVETVNHKPVERKFAPVNDIVERNPLESSSITKNATKLDFKEEKSDLATRVDCSKTNISKKSLLASTIIERNTSFGNLYDEPDEMNSDLMRQEVASQYYKMRNMFIQRQGGFMKEIERERVEFTEEEGGPKKISRFKAARVALSL